MLSGEKIRPGGNVRRSVGGGSAPVALSVYLCAVLSSAAEAQPAGPSVIAFTRATAQAVRIDASEAPVIDGDLTDAAWAKALLIDKFTQKQPHPGQPPTERTVLRIMFDENNLYFGVYNYDS